MFRTLSQRLAAAAFTVASLALPSALHAQKALVYCPVGVDATGCNTIVAALTATSALFPDGVDAGYDGTSGTVDLAGADLAAYSVFVVPSLADGPDLQPYALLRNGTIAARLRASFMGRVAVWSGTPDVGSTNRAAKDNLLRNLAAWAKPDSAGTHGPGVVALEDNSDDPAARYGWLGGISQLSLTADNTLDVYANVQVLTTTGAAILTGSGGLQIGYTNMGSYGLIASGASNDATGGRSTRVVLVTVAGEPSDPNLAIINTDKDDYQPGDTVLVTGSGWQPGETVSLLFHEDLDPPLHPDLTFTATADADGHIVNHEYLIDEEDLNVRFTLEATGVTSGKTAQATFTDAVNFQSVAVGTQTPTPITPGASATYTITVGFSGNNTPLCTVALSVTTVLPSGVTPSFSPATVASPGGTNQTSTLTLSSGAGTPTGVTSFNVRGVGTACTGTQNGTGNLDVKRASTTTVSGPATSSFGGSVTFGVTVTGGGPTPAGTVQFKDGATNLGALQTLSGGAASVNTSALTVGTHSITAVYSGDANYTGSTSGAFSHSVTRADQTITFTSTAPAAAAVGGATYTAAATATSGLTVAFSSQTPTICTSSGTNGATIAFIAAGSCTVAGNQAGNGNFNAAPQATQTFSVGKGGQTVAFTSTAPSAAAVGGPVYTATATGGASGNPVTFSATTPSVCTSSGTNGATITFIAAGSCTVAADQAGNANYDAANQVTQTFTVGKANQTIAFDLSTLPAKTFGDADFSVASFATASSGLTVSFSSGSITRCTVSTAGLVHIISAAGNCMVIASQAGDANYNAAPNAQQTFNVAKAGQTITFTSTAPVGAIVGGPTYTATATATSGLTVTFSSTTTGVCTSSGTNGATITFVGGGNCTVAANQVGNGDYNAAPQVTQTFAVSAQAPQTISFTSVAPSNAAFGGTYAVSATATSGLTVTFSSLTTGVCTVAGSTVSFVGVGSCTVAANQGGNASFLAAPQVTQTFAVGQASQTITFAALADKTYGNADFGVSATASSGLAVAFSASGQCTVAVATVHLTGAGSCTITASQAGNANYTAAVDVPRTFTIHGAPVAPVITVADRPYDGTTSATILTHNLTGIIGTDDVSLTGGTASFDTKHAGPGKTVTGSGFSLAGAAKDNYVLSPTTATTTAAISALPITVTATAETREYNGTTSSTAVPAVTVGAIQTGDAAAFTQSFDTKNIGTGKTLTPAGAVSDGNGGNNYEVSFQPVTTGAITAKALVGSITVADKDYDGNTSATITGHSLTGKVGTEDVSYVGGTATFDDRNAGIGKPVSATGLGLAGTDAGNYTVNTTASTTATIRQLAIAVTAVADTKPYDGNTSSTATPSITVGALATGDSPAFIQTFDNKNAGAGKTLTPSGSVTDGNGGANYDVTFHSVTTGKINQRALVVTATGVDKTYDGTTDATVTLADDRVANDVLTLAYATASFADRNAGPGKAVSVSGISVTGTDAGNYTFNTTASTTATIEQRKITVTAAADTKPYDGTTVSTATPTITVGSLATGDTPNFTQAFDTKHVGNPKVITASGSVSDGNGGNNYDVAFHTASGEIIARAITVTAATDSRDYDGTTNSAAVPTITVGTLATGDLAAFTQSFDTKHAGSGKTLTPAGAVNDGNGGHNYEVTFHAVNTGEIFQKAVTPVIVANDKPYDANTIATLSSQSVTGTISPDVVTLVVGAANFDTKQAGTNKLVTASLLSLGGANQSDYKLGALTATDHADIIPIALAVTAHGVNKVYDHTTDATVTLSATPLTGDVVTLSYTGASFADKNVGMGKPVSVSGIATGGADGVNYTPNTTATTSANITATPITITAQGVNRIYDATTAATVTLTVPSYLGDAVTGSYASASFANKNVGMGKAVSVSGIGIGGGDAFNYDLQNTTAATTANITKRNLTVTASAANKVFDNTTTASVTLSATPLLTDVVTISFTSANFDTPAVGANKTVTVLGVALGGTDGGNYAPVPVPVTTTASILAWTLAGYYQPVDMPTGGMVWNTVKGGSTVPLKFQIFSGSTERTDVASIKSFTATATSCGTPGTEDTVEITTTGGTELRYTGGQFIQNWQTPKSAGACYRTTMTAQDGSLLTAYFKLK